MIVCSNKEVQIEHQTKKSSDFRIQIDQSLCSADEGQERFVAGAENQEVTVTSQEASSKDDISCKEELGQDLDRTARFDQFRAKLTTSQQSSAAKCFANKKRKP